MVSKKIAGCLLAALLVSGCEITLETNVNASQLFSAQAKAVKGTLDVDTQGCDKESLPETQQSVAGVFPDAKYMKCIKNNDGGGIALFTVPVYVGYSQNGAPVSEEHINILSSERFVLAVAVPEAVRTRIHAMEDEQLGTLEYALTIRLKNDTKRPLRYDVSRTNIGDDPVVSTVSLRTPPGQSVSLQPFAELTNEAMRKGFAVILHRP